MEMNFNKHALEHERSRRTILETWHFLSGQYPYLATLARAILVLPSSTIPVQMRDFHTAKRNRLDVKSLESSLLIYQANRTLDFTISSEMIKNYNRRWRDEDENTDLEDNEEDHAETLNQAPKENELYPIEETKLDAIPSPSDSNSQTLKDYLD